MRESDKINSDAEKVSRLPFPRGRHGDGKLHSEALSDPVSGVWQMPGQNWQWPLRDGTGQT